MVSLTPSAAEDLDDVDLRIISALTQDGRMAVAALAEHVHVSRAHCYARLRRLQDSGVITGYSAVIDPVKIGLGASAHVMLKLRQHNWRALKAALLKIPEVWHVSLVGGNMDVLLLVRAGSISDLRTVVFDQIQTLPGVVDTQTYMIFEDIESRTALE